MNVHPVSVLIYTGGHAISVNNMTSNHRSPLLVNVQTTARVQVELINILFRQSRLANVGILFAIGLTTFVLWRQVPTDALIIWAIAACLITFARIALISYCLRKPIAPYQAIKWGWIYAVTTVFVGGFWGYLGFAFFSANNLLVIIFICLLMAGITSTGTLSLSAFWPAYCALVLPTILPLAFRCLFQGGELIPVVGVLLLFLLVLNLVLSRVMQKNMFESLSMRFENLELLLAVTVEKERVEAANRAKSHFLAAASHDLRQPIHAMALFVAALNTLAKRPNLKQGTVTNIAEHLQEALNGLGQLLNALLDVSRLDAGVVAANKKQMAIQDILTQIKNEFTGPANAKGLTLSVMPSSLWVDSDPIMLHRILSNLVANAIRYTHRGRIVVGCRRQNNSVELQILDTGIGIAQEQFAKIFQEFYQVQKPTYDGEQGFGLGLSIVRRLADLLGSQLTLQSTPGKGSAFSLKVDRVLSPISLAKSEQLAVQLPQQGKTILVIDDNREILAALQLLLSAWGHNPLLATNIEVALHHAREHANKIDLIFSDYRLAENVNGADAIHAVLACLERTVPAVIITGDTSPERIREASARGFELLHKPLDSEKLRQIIDT